MEEEGPINFKALRAKFQEEALLAQSKTSRPAVAEKPKQILPPGGHCTVVSSINAVAENKTPALPRVIFRDALRMSGGKRPISFPLQPQRTSPSSQLTNGDGTARHSRYMPLVLPVLPAKDQKTETPVRREYKPEPESGKEALPQTKIKKKALLLPFKSVKASKVSAESGDEPTYDDLTTRPCSAPGELPSVEKQTTEDGASLQSDQSNSEYPLSSPDVPVTPPSAETTVDSDNKIMSTLERAKKKFSRRNMLISSKPKSLHSPDNTGKEFTPTLRTTDSLGTDLPPPPPVCLSHLACISARPFFKTNNALCKSGLDKQLGREKSGNLPVKTVEPYPPCVPLKKPLPDLRTLGPVPAKPPRPPLVDLSYYHAPLFTVVSPSVSQAESEHPPVSNPLLDAPEFPDFENTEIETAESGGVDVAALELEALDLVSANPHTAVDAERPQADLSAHDPAGPGVSSIIQDLNLGSENIIPLDPASFPEPINLLEFPEPAIPQQRSQSKEVLVDSFPKSPSDETDVGVAECQSFPEEKELSSHSCGHQQDSYYETYTNIYEDVENMNKFTLSQNSTKRKGGLKNPYADHQPKESCVKRQKNPWVSVSGEHLAHNHMHSMMNTPNPADHKEQKKREKQRLEKEKKEQKEREKKENEMKKKFKVTGGEEPMYHAKVMVASKVRKNDLPVKSGDTVSIIRTTNCPKGKWLARDANNKYGYISVMNVELNIKEMLELGKKAQAAGRGGNMEGDNISNGSRSSNQPVLTSSFTDDSEEWAYEDETLSPFSESHSFSQQTASVPETPCVHAGAQNTPNDANLEDLHSQIKHEALQKLAVFFHQTKNELDDVHDDDDDDDGAKFTSSEPQNFLSAVEEPPYPEQEVDFTELELLPPPPLYADT
ncbi:NAD(P)H dehydrogenase (quinone) [Sarotherodon galilaeus]